MVFSSFVKRFQHSEKISFFQSAYPHFKSHNLTKFHTFFNTSWRSKYPHASAALSGTNYLGIDAGHYGLYYTIFNRDLDRKRSPSQPLHLPLTTNIVRELFNSTEEIDKSTRFFILQTKRDIDCDIDYLRNISQQYLSTFSPVASSVQTRYFSTSARKLSEKDGKSLPVDRTLRDIEDAREAETDQLETEEAIAASFSSSLVDQIVTAYTQHTSPVDLNIIYPLYQSLKRNELTLPSITEYNMVLKAVAARELDSNLSNEDIERKLTTLMTVYQDILLVSASANDVNLKPNKETFDVVLRELFQGANQSWAGAEAQCHYAREVSLTRSKEYAKLGADLFFSISDRSCLDLSAILPLLVSLLVNHPELVSGSIFKDMLLMIPDERSGAFHVDLVRFCKLAPGLSDEVLQHVMTFYNDFKDKAQHDHSLVPYEYDMYSAIIATCVARDNLPVATKFLDTILIDYKELKAVSGKGHDLRVPSKSQVSSVMSAYIGALNHIDLTKSTELVQTFSKVPYLPELMVVALNDTINALLARLESISTPEAFHTEYETIWRLYVRLAIRKDYHTTTLSLLCREGLLVVCIKLGHHDRVFQLIKEILLKNHLVHDLDVLRMCCSYLSAGYLANREQKYYIDLLWTLIDGQAEHYPGEHKNAFLLEFSPCLLADAEKHSLDLALNSTTIRAAFDNFDLQRDNVYGLFQVSKMFFACLDKTELTDIERFKMLSLLCQLSNQFTDTENHYVSLHPELVNFKSTLAERISSLFQVCEATSNFQMTGVVAAACMALDIPLKQKIENHLMEHPDVTVYDLDVSFHLNVNYKVGLARFVKLFREGYNFSFRTWNTVINSSLEKMLKKKSPISAKQFVGRFMALQNTNDEKGHICDRLLSLNSDVVNIALLNELQGSLDKTSPLLRTEVLVKVVKALEHSQNIYTRSIFDSLFEKVYLLNSQLKWVGEYLKLLVDTRNFEQFATVMKACPQILSNAKSSENRSIELTILLLRYYCYERDFSSFTVLIDLLEPQVRNKPEIAAQLVNFHLLKGQTNTAESLEASAPFVSFFKSLNETEGILKTSQNEDEIEAFKSAEYDYIDNIYPKVELSAAPKPHMDITSLALVVLSQQSSSDIVRVAMDNIKPILKSKTEFVQKALDAFLRAGVINHELGVSQSVLIQRFELFLYCLRALNIRSLNDEHLDWMIKFLTITGCDERVNTIVNKLVCNGQIADLVRFERLEFSITESSKQRLVEQLAASANYMLDPISAFTLKSFANHSPQAELPERDFELGVRGMLA